MKKITNSEKETRALAKAFAKGLKGGEVIGLIGDLGAGKTAFTKALAKALGVKNAITSPTFVLMKVYEVQSPKSKVHKVVHIDAYRIKSEKDLEVIGAREYFNDKESIVIIEWADMVKKILPKKAILVNIKHLGGNKRELEITNNQIPSSLPTGRQANNNQLIITK